MAIEPTALSQQFQRLERPLELGQASWHRTETDPKVSDPQRVDFGSVLTEAINGVNQLQSDAKTLRTQFDLGDRSVDLSQVMIAGAKSSVAFEATVQVRNKLVEAYKEIMSMPV